MDVKDWLPLIGVAVGWILNQLGHWFVFRREERKAIGRALADLLDIRHRMLSMTQAVDALSHRFEIPAEVKHRIRTEIERFFPMDADLGKRYNESVGLVSVSNPVLGFRLRSQDMVSPTLSQLRTAALSNGPEGGIFMAKLESEMMRHLEPHFEQLITLLARRHGWLTLWRVRRVLAKRLTVPEDLLTALAEATREPTSSARGSIGNEVSKV